MNVAKKNGNEIPATPAARRAAPRKPKGAASAPIDIASVTASEPLDSAADMGGVSAAASYEPTYDDIAQEAYQRYLSRGGGDGRDFDDWIEAERALARRNGG